MPYFCAMKYSRPSFPSEMRIDVPEEYTDRLLIGDTVLVRIKDIVDITTGVRRINFTISEFIRTVGHTDEPHDARPPVLLLQPALERTCVPHQKLLDELQPLFRNANDAMEFLVRIHDADNPRITDIVNEFAANRCFRASSRSIDLYRILRKHVVYTASRQNWNYRVKWKRSCF